MGSDRIGRTIFKIINDRKLPLEIVALNDLANPSELAYLLKYDSVHGVWPHDVQGTEDQINYRGQAGEMPQDNRSGPDALA